MMGKIRNGFKKYIFILDIDPETQIWYVEGYAQLEERREPKLSELDLSRYFLESFPLNSVKVTRYEDTWTEAIGALVITSQRQCEPETWEPDGTSEHDEQEDEQDEEQQEDEQDKEQHDDEDDEENGNEDDEEDDEEDEEEHEEEHEEEDDKPEAGSEAESGADFSETRVYADRKTHLEFVENLLEFDWRDFTRNQEHACWGSGKYWLKL